MKLFIDRETVSWTLVENAVCHQDGYTFLLLNYEDKVLKIFCDRPKKITGTGLIPTHFFISHYIPPIIFQLQLQGNQS